MLYTVSASEGFSESRKTQWQRALPWYVETIIMSKEVLTLPDVYSCLAYAIAANAAFAQQRLSVLECDEEQLEKQWDDSALARYCPDLTHLDSTMLQEALIELLCFYRINYEAMNRIYVRLV